MSISKKVIIMLILAGAFGALLIIVQSLSIRSVNVEEMTSEQTAPAVDMTQLAVEYRAGLDVIMPRYVALLQGGNEAIADVRTDLLALTMPPEYREAHAQLVLLLDALEDDSITLAQARAALSALTARYEWLSNYTTDVQ